MRAVSVLACILMLLSTAAAAGAPRTEDAETALRRQLVALLESKEKISGLDQDDPLGPIAEVPVLATFSCLLFEDDPQTLGRFYPRISEYVNSLFLPEHTTAAGFISGCDLLDRSGSAHPGINALAALELGNLARIAAAAGRYEDAIELRAWSLRFARSVQEYFFDYAAGIFMPVTPDGLFGSVYLPDQLLPFTVGRGLGARVAERMSERIFYETKLDRSGQRDGALWDDPVMRPLVVALLSRADGIPSRGLSQTADIPPGQTASRRSGDALTYWISYWNGCAGALARLDPPHDDIFILQRLRDLLEREELLLPELRAPFSADIDSVGTLLDSPSLGLERHRAAIAAVNRLLGSVSSTEQILEQGERIWKVFDEYRWDQLSPRQRKLVIETYRLSIEDLMAAKRTLSGHMMKTTGIVAEIVLPDRPVPAGLKVDIEAILRSDLVPIEIGRGFLQAAGNRWEIVGSGEPVRLVPQGTPLRWTKNLPIPPGSEAGLIPVDAFLDLLVDGERVELHCTESFVLTMGYDVTINFPEGRRFDGSPLPVNIVLKHPPGVRMQGSVQGVTTGGIECDPELPARFAVKEGSGITNLPLEVLTASATSPGRYPLNLSVLVDGSVVAQFDETIVRPIQWLHLGPMPSGSWILDNALSYTDDMLGQHETGDGGQTRWLRMPAGALDASGGVLPGRLYGDAPGRSMLLYTVLRLPSQRTVRWRLKTAADSRLWINGVPVSPSGGDASEGVTVLRAGNNMVLVASSWDGRPGAVLFEVFDDSGLPLAGLRNPVDEVVAELARRSSGSGGTSAAVMSDQPREVTFDLKYSGAREVSLIGEFNNWEPEAAPMRLLGGDMWRVTVFLPPGTYTYKFLVDRKTRIADPQADTIEPDGFGSLNSIITVK